MSNNPVYVVKGTEKLNKSKRKEYQKIARELFYPSETINALGLANTEAEANRILATARCR